MATVHVPVGANPAATRTALQDALNAAVAGDVITLAAGQLYTIDQELNLPNKGDISDYITIRSDADDADLPADGVRIDPSYSAFLPKLQSADTRAAIEAEVGSQHYKLMFLEFLNNDRGFGDVLMLGTNESKQEFWADQPNDIIVDRVYIHGDPVQGQKRGVALNGRNLVVKNSYIAGIFGVGQDAQAIATFNASGPLAIINNYLEASGYSYISGGDAPNMHTFATVATSPAPTTSSARLNTFRAGHDINTMRVGMHIAIAVNGMTDRRYSYVRSINTATNDITFDPIDVVPDSGEGTTVSSGGSVIRYTLSDIRWGEQPIGLTVQRNHITRDLRWLEAILDTPANVQAAPGTGGSLAAGTYYYRIQAYNTNGYNGTDTYSAGSTELSATVAASGKVDLSWDAVSGAEGYRIYRGTSAGTVTLYYTSATTSYSDTGSAGTAATSVKGSTKPVTKNLFELKVAMDVQFDSNILENHWPGSESGYAMWIKSNNYGETSAWCKTKNVVIENNIIRHVAGAFSLLVRVTNGGLFASGRLENVTVRNNLVYDSDDRWLYGKATLYGIKLEGEVQGLTFEHNTMLNTMRGAMYFDPASRPPVNVMVRNNLFRKETYGVFGGSTTAGSGTITHYILNGGGVFEGNVMAGASGYPSGTLQPSYTDFESQFVSYDNNQNGDYHLIEGSTFEGAGTDGLDIGCDVDAVLAATATVISGGAVSTPAPSVTTTQLPDGQATVAYSAQLLASGGTPTYTWNIASGTLPPGLSLVGDTISGTPTTPGDYAFTVEVTDAAAQTDTEDLSISIVAAPVTLSIPTASPLAGGAVGQSYSQVIAATGGTAPYNFTLQSGTLPSGLTLATDGTLSGIPTVPALASITVGVTDAVGGSTSKVFSLTVTGETLPSGRPIEWGLAEAKVFRRPTAPDNPADSVVKGDIWVDTSQTPPVPNVCVTVSPVVFEAFALNSAGVPHALLSDQHLDTVAASPSEGDLIVGSGDKWATLPAGGPGTYLRADGETVDWLPVDAADIKTGTLENARLPAQLDIASRVNSPVHGVDNYIAFTEAADIGAPSNARFGRIYYDLADRKFKAWENGTKKDLIGSGSSGGVSPVTLSFILPAGASNGANQANNVPAGGSEFPGNSRARLRANLTGFSQAKLYGYIVTGGITGSFFKVQYYNGTSWVSLLASGELQTVGSSAGSFGESMAYADLAEDAKREVTLRIYLTDGDGVQDPTISSFQLLLK